MSASKKIWLARSIGAIGACACYYFLLEDWIIPDSCLYHDGIHHPGLLFRLFNAFPASEGGHPAPTLLLWIVAGVFGALSGALIVKYLPLK